MMENHPYRYKDNVSKLSALMHEHIEQDPPLDRAVQAIEYVIRHRGAPHLRPASCRLSMLQREGMDVMIVLLFVTLAFCYSIIRLCYAVTANVFKRVKTDQLHKKNQ